MKGETGDRRQETGDRRQETGDRRREEREDMVTGQITNLTRLLVLAVSWQLQGGSG